MGLRCPGEENNRENNGENGADNHKGLSNAEAVREPTNEDQAHDVSTPEPLIQAVGIRCGEWQPIWMGKRDDIVNSEKRCCDVIDQEEQ